MFPLSLRRFLGSYLLACGGVETPLDEIIISNDEEIALFFSAEWAPNNSIITDQLSRFCQKNSKEPMKIVFVSIDEDADGFQRQLDSIPWMAVPFADIRRRLRLLRQYRVSNLPFLVILNRRTGRCLSRVSSSTLLADPDCALFPWNTSSPSEVLKKVQMVDSSGTPIDYDAFQGCILGLYFSANWCPPCRAFTPQLINLYKIIKAKFNKFEIVFVSSDRTEASFKSYHASMPWPGIGWECPDERRDLAKALEVKGIPTLVLLDADHSVITREGRYFAAQDAAAEKFPWRPQTVELLQQLHVAILLKNPSLIFFTDGESDELRFGRDVLQPTAEKYFSDNSDDVGMSLMFFVAGEDDVSDEVRNLANLDDVIPLVVIIDLAEGSKYLMEEGVELSNSTLHSFVTRYANDELTPMPIEELHHKDHQHSNVHVSKELEVERLKLSDLSEVQLIEENL